MPIIAILVTGSYSVISPNACNILFKIAAWSSFSGIAISECILLLRTIAMHSGAKRVIIPLSSIYVAALTLGIVNTWRFLHKTSFISSPNPLFKGCYPVQENNVALLIVGSSVSLAFELVVVILTVRSGLRDFYSGTPFIRVVYRDSMASFVVLFALMISSVLVYLLAPPQFSGFIASYVRVAHSIICCRILLNIRRAASPRGASTVMRSLAFTNAPGQRTSQAGTIRSEIHSVWSDEGIPVGGRRGTLLGGAPIRSSPAYV